MSGAHDRLEALWDALEAQGATVMRVPLDAITARTANRIAQAEEKRLAVLAESAAPAPVRIAKEPASIERLVLLVDRATRGS